MTVKEVKVIITTFKHSGNKHTLRFTPGNHQYRVCKNTTGKWDHVPSVTRITGQLDKSEPLVRWASKITAEYFYNTLIDKKTKKLKDFINPEWVLDAAKNATQDELRKAGDIGTKVHKLIESYLVNGKKPRITKKNEHKDILDKAFLAFTDWQKEIGWTKTLVTEKILYHPTLGYCGTVDIIAMIKNGSKQAERYVIDIKTSNHFHAPAMPMQLVAYMEAWNVLYPKRQIKSAGIIKINKQTGGFNWIDCTPVLPVHWKLFKELVKVSKLDKQAKAAVNKLKIGK